MRMKQIKYSHKTGRIQNVYRRKKSRKKIWKGRSNGICAGPYGFQYGKGRDRRYPRTKVTEGSMLVEGKDLEQMSAKELELYRRNQLGFVFQFYNLTPDLTVRENIEMTAELVNDPVSVDTLLENLGLVKYQKHFPKELSGGQQQRVAIARAMVKKPDILLCDELTGALDTKSSRDVLMRVQQMNETYHTTVVIITHNLNIAKMADRIIRITDGKVTSNRKNEDKQKVEEMEL